MTWSARPESTHAGQPNQPDPTASATPSPPDAKLADRLAARGDVDAAIGAYAAVAAQGTGDERLAARLALAKLYLANGEAASAAAQIEAYLLEAPGEIDVRAAQYLLADALVRQGDDAGALPLYEAYIEGGGGGSSYARLDRVEALLRLGRFVEAAAEADDVRDEQLPDAARLPFLRAMAQGFEDALPQTALKYYGALGEASRSPGDQALALWRSAVIESNGNDGLLIDPWVEIIQRYPETDTAQTIVDAQPVAKTLLPLDGYYTGLVYYRAGRSADARPDFEASFEANRGGPDRSLAARSAFYLAVFDERAGSTDAAISGYGQVLDLDANVEQADDALWWQAQLLEEAGRQAEADAAYQRLDAEYSGSDYAVAARLKLALVPYDQGAYEDAADAFAAIASKTTGKEHTRSLLWQGKSLASAGDENGAEAVWRRLEREAPGDYYALRAAALLGEANGDLESAGLNRPVELDWRAIETWLREATGADPKAAFDLFLYSKHWGLGQELLALGMSRRANAEFAQLLDGADDDPAALYQAARFFHWVGMTDLSARAATRLLSVLPDARAQSAPADVWRLAYPAPFVDVLSDVSAEEDAPDVLVLAMVRQESFFDPLAGSSAGALGLTQVIPSTGEAIADELDLSDFEVDDLFRPSVSLRFGAYYIGQQLSAFDGNPYYALAAYNGGPGNAERWRDAAGDDIDRFVEEITYSETRAYVRIVLENLARYRQLYAGLDAPSLPKE
ncbi:MAG: lytic transglycosylase domain-containing protein [Dehalococcoidia bacterium]